MAAATPPASPPRHGAPASKRTSTGDPSSRYPSPPLDSFAIPPFNPNSARRRSQQPPPNQDSSSSQQGRAGMLGHDLPGVGGAHGGLPAAGTGHREGRHRPASAAVVPAGSSTQYSPMPPTHSAQASRTRASHHIAPVTGHSQTVPNTSNAQGMAGLVGLGHQMPRTRIYFGPYLLLQTLGEGEFGKVKLGVHSAPERWGEEVAIKLIKRGNVDTQARMIKVQREIEVLRMVHHPNIVALHDVIETEKYIGIVLEYASGGELFDHILAHRYLKEKDACKLFAQLISGVIYLHSKKIVHRDLKLENLLLDRNRNIMITDFGFANRFEERGSDLMATSCGSPCYAAPELVVQDGRYVGSAVDVWSCGVILYAMLAGYLPFDDDPANPDGDNINLLYKYIINTPLSFPDWITAEPRDLLLKMLVPDPTRRSSLTDVARHPWLRRHAALFDRSIEELETTAQSALTAKRESLQREKLLMAQQQAMAQQQQQGMGRSQSSVAKGMGVGGRGHQSAMVTSATSDHLYSTSGHGTGVVSAYQQQIRQQHPGQPTTPSQQTQAAGAVGRRGHSAVVLPTTVAQYAHPVDDAFSHGPTMPVAIAGGDRPSAVMAPSRIPEGEGEDVAMADAPPSDVRSGKSSDSSATKRRKAAGRHTVQVEYDSSRPSAHPASAAQQEQRSKPSKGKARDSTTAEDDAAMLPPEPTSGTTSFETARQTVFSEPGLLEEAIVAANGPIPGDENARPARTEDAPATPPVSDTPKAASPQATPRASVARQKAQAAVGGGDAGAVAASDSPINGAKGRRNVSHASGSVPFPDNASQSERGDSRTSITSNSDSQVSTDTKKQARHRKGLSTDRFFSKLLGGPSSQSVSKGPVTGARPGSTAPVSSQNVVPNGTRPPTSAPTEPRKTRRKALSMVVEPLSKAGSSKNRKSGKVQDSVPPTPTTEKRRSRVGSTAAKFGGGMSTSAVLPGRKPPSPTAATSAAAAPSPQTVRQSSQLSVSPSLTGSQQSGGKAKRVMDWFRFKSLNEVPATGPAPIETDFDHRNTRSRRESKPVHKSVVTAARSENRRTPSVVITEISGRRGASGTTTEGDTARGSRSASGTTTQSASTAATTATNPSATPTPAPAPNGVRKGAPPAPKAVSYNDAKLKLHHGAIDQNALSDKSPPLLMTDVRKVLWDMGIDVAEESAMKLKATRRSRKKVAASLGLGVGALPGLSQQSYAIDRGSSHLTVGSSNQGVPAGLATSPSSTFRSLFQRKGSSNSVTGTSNVTGGSQPSPALSVSTAQLEYGDGMPMSPQPTSASGQPLPSYADDPSVDSGDDVRFTVEITKMKGLEGLYAVDIKRLRGSLWSFKYLYLQILDRLALSTERQ